MTESIVIAQQGELAKFIVSIEDTPYFRMVDGDFRVILHYGMSGGQMIIEKSDMTETEEGYILTVDTSKMVGRVIAEFQWDIEDADLEEGEMTRADRQLLMFVAATACPRLMTCPVCSGETHLVSYTHTFVPSLSMAYYYLTDTNGNRLMSTEADGTHNYLLTRRTTSNA